MEDKNQDQLTVENILDQLVRPNVLETPGIKQRSVLASPPSSVGEALSIFSRPTSPSPILPIGGIKLPSLKISPGQTITESGMATSVESKKVYSSADFRLSIRTMTDDLSRLKKGEKPSGLEIQKAMVVEERGKQAEVLKYQSQVPEARIQLPSKPQIKPPPLSRQELSSVGSSPRLFASQKSRVKESTEEKVEYKVIARVVSSGMVTGVLITMVIGVVVYLGFYFYVLKQDEVVIVTPIPTENTQASSEFEVSELEMIFKNIAEITFPFLESDQESLPKLRGSIDKENPDRGQFIRINFTIPGQSSKPKLPDILNKLSVNFLAELRDQVKDDNLTLLYGQQALSNNRGEPVVGGVADKRIIFVVEIKDQAATLEVMRKWEETLGSDLGDLFSLDVNQKASLNFIDNDYRGLRVRYKNFPFPDRSIDYAVVRSLAGRNYLVIANSRESMYSFLDKVRGH